MRAEKAGMDHGQQEVVNACEHLHGMIRKAYWNVSSDEVKEAIAECAKVVHELWISLAPAVSGVSQTLQESMKSARAKLLIFLGDRRLRPTGLDTEIRKVLDVTAKFLASLGQNNHDKLSSQSDQDKQP